MKTRFLLPSLLMATYASAAPIKDNTITGSIADWPAGKTGEVRLVVMSGMPNWIDETVLAQASVDDQGHFSLKLPEAATAEKVLPDAGTMGKLVYSLPFGDSNSLMNLSREARVNLFQLVAFTEGNKLDTVKLSSTPRRNLVKGDSFALLAYSSADTTLTSELSGFHRALLQSSAQVWNVPLSSGWNWVMGQTDSFDPATGLWPITYSAAEPAKSLSFQWREGVGGIGVTTQETDPTGEVNVIGVVPGSPAEAAGVQVGDTILKIDAQELGKATNLYSEASARLMHGEVGTPVTLTIRRGTQTLEIKVNRALLPASVSQTTG